MMTCMRILFFERVQALFQDSVVERIVEDTVCGAFADAVASDMFIPAR